MKPQKTLLVVALTWLVCMTCRAWATEAESGGKPLWDGKTFAGWHKIGSGDWTVEEGAIVGRHKKEDGQFGHLVSDAVFKDFTVRLKFKSIKGNSGFYFRVDESGFSGVSGFQAEIDPTRDTGGLYETGGRAWVVKPSTEMFKEVFKPDDWNEMTVSARGGHVIVRVNGIQTAELKDDPGRAEGHLALQLHGGNEMLVMFKDIEILD